MSNSSHFDPAKKMSTIGNISAKSFYYWKQMSTIGKAESGRAWQVNKVLSQWDRKEFVEIQKYREVPNEKQTWWNQNIVALRTRSRRDEIKLWSRNQSWARGAAKFILANKSWACAAIWQADVWFELTSRRVLRVDKRNSNRMRCGEEMTDEEKC